MKRFRKQELDPGNARPMEIAAGIARVILSPIFLVVRIYCWIWDYNYYERFKRH